VRRERVERGRRAVASLVPDAPKRTPGLLARRRRRRMMAFGLGSGIAGLAGVALSQVGNVGPELGQSYIIDSFIVVVLGGVGQLLGTVVAGFGLGVANKLLEPGLGAVVAKILILALIIAFIQKRPSGLFALKGRTVEA
jgi:urea transport system permease protein